MFSPKNKMGSSCLTGKKVCLMPFTEKDITPEYICWLNDSKTMKFSSQKFKKHTVLSCKKYLKTFQTTENLFLKIVNRENNATVGTMTAYVSVPHKTVDIGILIGKRNIWGKGFGGDAWGALFKWLINSAGARKLTAGTVINNTAMVRIFKNSGMIQEGLQRQQILLNGKPRDMVFYGKICNFMHGDSHENHARQSKFVKQKKQKPIGAQDKMT